jgi:IBR (half RING finger) domain-containing protein
MAENDLEFQCQRSMSKVIMDDFKFNTIAIDSNGIQTYVNNAFWKITHPTWPEVPWPNAVIALTEPYDTVVGCIDVDGFIRPLPAVVILYLQNRGMENTHNMLDIDGTHISTLNLDGTPIIDQVPAGAAISSTATTLTKRSKRKSIIPKRKAKVQQNTQNFCLSCADELESDDEFIILHKTRRQSHGLCQDCMGSYLLMVLQEKSKDPKADTIISCCGNFKSSSHNVCGVKIELNPANVISRASQKSLSSLLKFIKANDGLNTLYMRVYSISLPNSVMCILCQGIITDVPKDTRNIHCPYCQKDWCQSCHTTPYHVGKSCPLDGTLARFYKDNGDGMREAIERGDFKICPTCNELTAKSEGCNKMTCGTCQHSWCWICREADIDYPHFNYETGNPECRGRLHVQI